MRAWSPIASPPTTSAANVAHHIEPRVPNAVHATKNSRHSRRFLKRVLTIAPVALSRACMRDDPV